MCKMTASLVASSVLLLWGGAVGCRDSSAPSPVQFTATLNAANELRTLATPSTATGTAVVVVLGDTLTWVVTAAGLTSRVIASHIHVGTATTPSGNIVHGFQTNAVTSGTVATGSVLLSSLVASTTQVSGDSLRKLLTSGNAYVNIHTTANPPGEIRGQLVQQ